MQVLVRPAKASDLNFVFDSWMKSWRESKWSGVIPNHLYYDTQRTLIEDLLSRGAKVYIVHPEHAENVILAWGCSEEKNGTAVVHYVYVKDPFLAYGLQNRLLESIPGIKPGFITHQLRFKEFNKWRHVPEMARRKTL